MNESTFDITLLGPPLLAGILVLASHVPLGIRVLERGIIFIDLALAQIAGLGVIALHALGGQTEGVLIQAGAFGAACAGALLLFWTERRWPHLQEALIGSLFILAATGAILLLAGDPRSGEHLKDLLVGEVLWLSYGELAMPALLTLLILGTWLGVRGARHPLAFYLLFALAVTTSLQLVGVYLVFASLILPALGAYSFPPVRRQVIGYAIGLCGYCLGLALSALLDLPTGPMIVWCLAASALATAAVGRLIPNPDSQEKRPR